MATLSYRTAGESHGKALIALVEGMPAGVTIDKDFIDSELRRRQGGYGRGGRQKIETDHVDFLSGVRLGKSIASPITMLIPNKDSRLDDLTATPPLHRPRPGHADLAGSIKWLTTDCRETLERASARETAARVAAGALSRCFLRAFGIEVFGFVRTVGEATAKVEVTAENWKSLVAARDASEVYCPDPEADAAMRDFINQQKIAKDTAGGIVETHVFGCPVGLGSCMAWDTRLDSRIAAAVVGIQAFKGVEFGLGFETARRPDQKFTMKFCSMHRKRFADAWICSHNQQRRWARRRNDQRSNRGGSRGNEADQHFGETAPEHRSEYERAKRSGLGTKRH